MLSPEAHISFPTRKEQLIEACVADRNAWRRACRTDSHPPKTGLVHKVLGNLDLVFHLLPTSPKLWLRSVSLVGGFVRKFVLGRR